MADAGIVLEITDRLRAFQQARQRLRVLVHRGFLHGGPVPFYFVKVTNLSSARDVVITHVWFEAAPPVHLLLEERPLPKRLRPDETWEAWLLAADLAHAQDVERLGRVLMTAKRNRVVKSRPNTETPPAGFVPGAEFGAQRWPWGSGGSAAPCRRLGRVQDSFVPDSPQLSNGSRYVKDET
jgi:hypothetical protein